MTKSPATISRDWLLRAVAALPWAVACGMLAYAFIAGGFFVTIMSFAMIYAVFVIGLNVFMGFAGQVSFGHNAFAALSGYASAVLTATYFWDPLPAFAVGLGLAIGVAASLSRRVATDRLLTALSLLSASTPSYWLALMLMLVFSVALVLLTFSFIANVTSEWIMRRARKKLG